MMHGGVYWAWVAEVTVDITSGVVKTGEVTMVVDPGIVTNPLQLKRQIEGGSYSQGSEATNALAAPAIASAFLDATGKIARRVLLKPAYVTQILKA